MLDRLEVPLGEQRKLVRLSDQGRSILIRNKRATEVLVTGNAPMILGGDSVSLRIDSKVDGSVDFGIGVMYTKPDVPWETLFKDKKNEIWYFSGNRILIRRNGKWEEEKEYSFNLNNIMEGDIVGLTVTTQGNLVFLLNGVSHGVAGTKIPRISHFFLLVRGGSLGVSLVNIPKYEKGFRSQTLYAQCCVEDSIPIRTCSLRFRSDSSVLEIAEERLRRFLTKQGSNERELDSGDGHLLRVFYPHPLKDDGTYEEANIVEIKITDWAHVVLFNDGPQSRMTMITAKLEYILSFGTSDILSVDEEMDLDEMFIPVVRRKRKKKEVDRLRRGKPSTPEEDIDIAITPANYDQVMNEYPLPKRSRVEYGLNSSEFVVDGGMMLWRFFKIRWITGKSAIERFNRALKGITPPIKKDLLVPWEIGHDRTLILAYRKGFSLCKKILRAGEGSKTGTADNEFTPLDMAWSVFRDCVMNLRQRMNMFPKSEKGNYVNREEGIKKNFGFMLKRKDDIAILRADVVDLSTRKGCNGEVGLMFLKIIGELEFGREKFKVLPLNFVVTRSGFCPTTVINADLLPETWEKLAFLVIIEGDAPDFPTTDPSQEEPHCPKHAIIVFVDKKAKTMKIGESNNSFFLGEQESSEYSLQVHRDYQSIKLEMEGGEHSEDQRIDGIDYVDKVEDITVEHAAFVEDRRYGDLFLKLRSFFHNKLFPPGPRNKTHMELSEELGKNKELGGRPCFYQLPDGLVRPYSCPHFQFVTCPGEGTVISSFDCVLHGLLLAKCWIQGFEVPNTFGANNRKALTDHILHVLHKVLWNSRWEEVDNVKKKTRNKSNIYSAYANPYWNPNCLELKKCNNE